MNTLPLPSEVLTKWFTVNAKSERFIAQIYCEKRNNVEICRSEETIKFTMHKLMWFSLLHNQLFYPLPLIDQKQVNSKTNSFSPTKPHFRLLMEYDN